MIDWEALQPLILALIGAGGVWQLLSLRAKQAHEKMMREREDRHNFNDTLREQVDRLADQVNTLVREKEALLNSMAELKAELAAAQTTIRHLENSLMARQ